MARESSRTRAPQTGSNPATARPDTGAALTRYAGRLVLIVIGAVVLIETVVLTTLLRLWPGLSGIHHSLLDAALEFFLFAPLFYFFLYLPMSRQIGQRLRTEESLRRAHDELEQRVQERTAELEASTQELLLEIEERQRAQEALKESERKYRQLVEHSLTGVYIHQHGKFVFVNQTLADIHGYSREEMIGADTGQFEHPEDRHRLSERSVKRQVGEEVSSEYEFRGLTKAGQTVWLNVRSSRIEYRGEPAVMGNVVDITKRKLAEQAFLDSQQEVRRLSSRMLTAQEFERGRMARELHDGIGQALSAIKYFVENSIRAADEGRSKPGIEALRAIVPKVQETVEEVRRLSMDLRPSSLDDLGLLPTLGWFCREFQTLHPDIRVEARPEVDEGRIPEMLKTVIYRIIQEALSNVAKHSHADRVIVALKLVGNELELVVQDNGRGFDPQEVTPTVGSERGYGLGSMRERAELSGGTVSVDCVEGSGTTVRACWALGAVTS